MACAVDYDGETILLFNRAGSEYVQIINGKASGRFPLNSPAGKLSGCPFTKIGAAQGLMGELYIYDEAGTKFAIKRSNGSWSPITSLDDWGHPFRMGGAGSPAGVGAALQEYIQGQSLHWAIHFNRTGDQYLWYASGQPPTFSREFNTFEYGSSRFEGDMPFLTVGAALGFQTHSADIFPEATTHGVSLMQVLFNSTGTACVFYSPAFGFSEVFTLI